MTSWTRLRAGALCVSVLLMSVLSTGVPSASAAGADPGSSPSAGYVLPAHVPYYVVPDNQNVFAYALASQLLGNGNLDTEIFQLNQGRLQPTGDSWNQLTAIEPGWYLVLPCGATGSDAGVSVQWNPPPQDVPPGEVPASAICPASAGPADTPVPAATGGVTGVGPGYYQILNGRSGLALSVENGSTAPGAQIVQSVPGNSAGQQWQLTKSGRHYTLTNVGSGLVLDVPKASKKQGIEFDQQSPGLDDGQTWTITTAGGGYYLLANSTSGMLADDGKTAATPGAPVLQWPFDNGTNEQWKFVPLPGPTASSPPTKAVAAGKSSSGSSSIGLYALILALLLVLAGGFGFWRWRTANAGPGDGGGPAKAIAPKPAAAKPAAPKPAAPKPAPAKSGMSRIGRRKPPPVTEALLADPQTVAVAAQALAGLTPSASWWPYAAAVGEEQVTVWLAGMEVPEPSEPWQPVEGDTRAWTAPRAELAAPAEEGQTGQDAILAVLGVLDDAVAVLEVTHSHGVLAVGGDPRWAPRVHESLAAQLLGGEVLLRSPGEADPVGGRPHWALDVDGEGWVTVHGRRVRFAAPPEPGLEPEPAPVEPPPPAPETAQPLENAFPELPEPEPDLGVIAVSAQPAELPGEPGAPG